MLDTKITVFCVCGKDSLPAFKGVLEANAPAGCELLFASDLTSLREGLAKVGPRARLISYLNNDIIPADILRRFDLGAYNFHPGTPDYPGTAPEAWASYDQASSFGATLHAMDEKVDSGAIIDVARAPVPSSSHRLVYAEIAHRMSHFLLCKTARQLTSADAILSSGDAVWTGKKRWSFRVFRG